MGQVEQCLAMLIYLSPNIKLRMKNSRAIIITDKTR